MDKNVFDAYSQYYDLLYKGKNYVSETDYVDSLIQKYLPNASTILELGCGTGIHASKLAEKNYTVVGIDKSESMLHRAELLKSKLPNYISQKLSFSMGDIRTFEIEQKFDAVISLFHVISYMTSDNDLVEAIQTAKKHLNENGVFKDYELNMEFSDFGLYQNELFKKYVFDRKNLHHLEKIEKVERHLHKLAKRYFDKDEETFETLEFKKAVIEIYYNGESEVIDNNFRVI